MPQGTLLGIILYILYINPVGFSREVTIDASDIIRDYWKALEDFPNIPTNSETLPDTLQSIKFMDDATLQEKINLKDNLATNIDRSGPLPCWELGSKQENGKVLPKENSLLQLEINKIKRLSDDTKRTENLFILINFTQQFRPLLQIPLCESIIDRVLAIGLQQT